MPDCLDDSTLCLKKKHIHDPHEQRRCAACAISSMEALPLTLFIRSPQLSGHIDHQVPWKQLKQSYSHYTPAGFFLHIFEVPTRLDQCIGMSLQSSIKSICIGIVLQKVLKTVWNCMTARKNGFQSMPPSPHSMRITNHLRRSCG